MKTLFVGITAQHFEAIENLCQAPSLFDYDAVVIDAYHIWPPDMREPVIMGSATDVGERAFGNYAQLLSRRLREAKLLLQKGGIIVCLLRPVTIVCYTKFEIPRPTYPSTSSYDWLPINRFRDYVITGRGVRTKRVRSSPFDDYLKLEEVEWFAYLSKEFQPPQYEQIVVNDANLAVAAKVIVDHGTVYLLPIANHDKLPEILVSDLAKALKLKTLRPIPSWLSGVFTPGEKEIVERLTKVREQIAEIRASEESLEQELEEKTSVKLLLYEQGDVLHDVVEEVLNELGFMVKREGDKDLVSTKDPSRRVVFEVTGTEGTIDVDKLRQLIDYVETEKKESGKLPKSVLIGNHQIDVDPRKRSAPFTDKAVQQSKVYGTCLLPSIELFKAIVALRQSKLDAKRLWDAVLSTEGVFALS